MLSARELRAILKRRADNTFSQLGLTRASNASFMYYREMDDGVLGFLGFGLSNFGIKGVLYINVSFCVVNKNVQKLFLSLFGLKDYDGYINNPMENLDCLVEGKSYNDLTWKVKEEEDINEAIGEIVYYYTNYINPFFNQFNSWEKYSFAVKDYKIDRSGRNYILPIIYYLEGNLDRALEYITQRAKDTKAYSNKSDELFIKNFRIMCQTQTIDKPLLPDAEKN